MENDLFEEAMVEEETTPHDASTRRAPRVLFMAMDDDGHEHGEFISRSPRSRPPSRHGGQERRAQTPMLPDIDDTAQSAPVGDAAVYMDLVMPTLPPIITTMGPAVPLPITFPTTDPSVPVEVVGVPVRVAVPDANHRVLSIPVPVHMPVSPRADGQPVQVRVPVPVPVPIQPSADEQLPVPVPVPVPVFTSDVVPYNTNDLRPISPSPIPWAAGPPGLPFMSLAQILDEMHQEANAMLRAISPVEQNSVWNSA